MERMDKETRKIWKKWDKDTHTITKEIIMIVVAFCILIAICILIVIGVKKGGLWTNIGTWTVAVVIICVGFSTGIGLALGIASIVQKHHLRRLIAYIEKLMTEKDLDKSTQYFEKLMKEKEEKET